MLNLKRPPLDVMWKKREVPVQVSYSDHLTMVKSYKVVTNSFRAALQCEVDITFSSDRRLVIKFRIDSSHSHIYIGKRYVVLYANSQDWDTAASDGHESLYKRRVDGNPLQLQSSRWKWT
ncbi:hypothetical protein TNCV_1594971 [Trichonephila clavipes]|nr:hypothetical protein TNCV_1594971 [Trichonephila clavipes]